MYLPPQEAAKRAVERFLGKTKRLVPPGVVLGTTTNEGSFDQVKSWSMTGLSETTTYLRGRNHA